VKCVKYNEAGHILQAMRYWHPVRIFSVDICVGWMLNYLLVYCIRLFVRYLINSVVFLLQRKLRLLSERSGKCRGIDVIKIKKRIVRKPTSELRGVTCHKDSESVPCHPTEVNTPRLNPSQASWYSIYLPQRDGRMSWHRWLAKYWNGLPACRRSPIRTLTWPAVLLFNMC